MKWLIKDPVRGDMVRVDLGGIYHFGIYVSDDEVIQFGLAPSRRNLLKDSDVEVLSTDIYGFLAGSFLEVCEFDRRERKKNRTPDEIVEYARSKMGMRGYSVLYNNCEHFANECVTGVAVCNQADRVRDFFRSLPIVDVYLAKLPEGEIGESLSCDLRQKEIDAVTNEKVKREKYYVWKLFEYALQRSFGLKAQELEFIRDENRRYVTDRAEFSFSHSKGALAVAVSRGAVGVDIEPSDTESSDSLAKRIMNAAEYSAFERLDDGEKQKYFVKVWTAKEALFKASHKGAFYPCETDTENGGFKSFVKIIDGREYTVSVATDTPERIRFFENIAI